MASASASILYLRLDAQYDPVFDTNAELSDLQAVEQAIKTRLLLFEGEWWENLNEGTPMFQEILGSRASASGQQIMALALINRIAGTPYVTAVQNVNISFNPTNRSFSFSCIAQTAFGSINVNFVPQPGLNAATYG